MKKFLITLLLIATPVYAGVISTRNVINGVSTIAQDDAPSHYLRDTTDDTTMLIKFDAGEFSITEGSMESFVDEDDWVAGTPLFILTTGDQVRFPTMTSCNLDTDVSGNLVCGSDSAGHSDGANCSAGSYPLGTDGDGAAQGCTDATTEIDSAITTHTAIASAHHTATVDTSANTECSGTTTYLDGEGGCDDISSVYAPIVLNVATKTTTYTAQTTDDVIIATSGTFTITLYAASGNTGETLTVKNSGSGVVTIDGNSSETIDGETTIPLSQYDSADLVCDGSNWIIR